MNMNDRKPVPEALDDAWAWKDQVYVETAAMDTAEALEHIHAGSDAIRERYGLRVASPPNPLGMVAEDSPDYGSGK